MQIARHQTRARKLLHPWDPRCGLPQTPDSCPSVDAFTHSVSGTTFLKQQTEAASNTKSPPGGTSCAVKNNGERGGIRKL